MQNGKVNNLRTPTLYIRTFILALQHEIFEHDPLLSFRWVCMQLELWPLWLYVHVSFAFWFEINLSSHTVRNFPLWTGFFIYMYVSHISNAIQTKLTQIIGGLHLQSAFHARRVKSTYSKDRSKKMDFRHKFCSVMTSDGIWCRPIVRIWCLGRGLVESHRRVCCLLNL